MCVCEGKSSCETNVIICVDMEISACYQFKSVASKLVVVACIVVAKTNFIIAVDI